MRPTTRLLRHAALYGKAIVKELDHYSQFHPSALSIQHFVDFGRNGDQKASYLFLRKELLVRLSGIMKEISLLPQELLQMPSAKLVQEWYHQSFSELLKYAEKGPDEPTMTEFTQNLSGILSRHAHVVETMAEGLMELKFSHGIDVTAERNLQYFLDRFYINRISIRMLINQHTLLFGGSIPESPRHIGCIDPATDVCGIIEDAYENARFLCDRYYMTSPKLSIESKNAVAKGQPITIEHVPSHLYHIVFELIKNAMRAVVEHNGVDKQLPDLKVYVIKGKEDVSIKISDRGGGVTRNVVDHLFNYMYTSAPPPDRDGDQAPLAGYGYGLPLSRLYARYFQGDTFLVSMEGYGTDACVYLRALAVDASELLPIYGSASRRVYASGAQAADWSVPSNAAAGQSFRAYSTLMGGRIPYFTPTRAKQV